LINHARRKDEFFLYSLCGIFAKSFSYAEAMSIAKRKIP
jgi:hypothetical protein